MELPNKFTVPVILIYKANNIVIKCYIYNYHEEINKDTLNPKKLYIYYKKDVNKKYKCKTKLILEIIINVYYNKRRFYHKFYSITVSAQTIIDCFFKH